MTYAYSGWNAATYILGELERPQETLPKVLVVGCATVMITYVVLHLVLLSSAPIDSLEGQVEIAFVVAEQIMGSAGAFVVSLLLAGILISTISAMVMALHALQRLGEDYPLFDYLGRRNKADIPVNAIVFMAGIALLFLWDVDIRADFAVRRSTDGHQYLRDSGGCFCQSTSVSPHCFCDALVSTTRDCVSIDHWLDAGLLSHTVSSAVGACFSHRRTGFSLPSPINAALSCRKLTPYSTSTMMWSGLSRNR